MRLYSQSDEQPDAQADGENTQCPVSLPQGTKDSEKPDAGLKSIDHCMYSIDRKRCSPILTGDTDKQRLPSWRYSPRQCLIPIVRLETPYLAWMQDKVRSPALDSYFALTANLGTHTFFLVVLPILFWCGYTSLGRGCGYITVTLDLNIG